MRSRTKALLLAIVVAGLAYVLFVNAPAGRRSLRDFEPDRVADLEVEMWRAYYAKQDVRLFELLVTLLREQYKYTWAKATQAGFHLARAAARFGNARSGYERVLPDLEAAYAIAKQWTASAFDPRAVARAELAWWVARREPGRDGPEQIGRLIAEEYALLYNVPVERVAEAGLLRAQAAALRDRGGAQADWPAVGRLLRESFRSLHGGVADTPGQGR